MIQLRFLDSSFVPSYQTQWSSGADLLARDDSLLLPQTVTRVPTGVWIESCDFKSLDENEVCELQIRARSGLAFKHGIALANGVGTIDADYREEIAVLLINHSQVPFQIHRHDRIAQLVLARVWRIPNLKILDHTRIGGFGSTGNH